jgi:hypothetical protein
VDVDQEFMQRVYARCGPNLDVEVAGEEVAREVGLSEAEAKIVLDRLVRTGYLRDVGAGYRMKITIRGISSAEHERAGTERENATDESDSGRLEHESASRESV